MKSLLLAALGSALLAPAASHAVDSCEVNSGTATAALVELYTSEGCSSCPPADRQLSALKRQLDAGAVVVPLSLHVTYWNRIGWKDAFAQKAFDERQGRLLENRRNKVVYTPQFFVNGDELRDWGAQLPAAIRRTNATPAPLAIRLKSTPGGPAATAGGAATLTLDAEVAAPDPRTSGQLYMAIAESGLTSNVSRGENRGVTLRHDNTVRLWLGPFPLSQGKARVRQAITLPAAWNSERVHAVALVQDAASGRILQAVGTGACAAAASTTAR
jgi:hypothetical protein